jgi:pimeloyl-ACP methyl ester carboxylesterase
VLIGHGGTQHKKVANVLGLARQLVRHLGYAVVAIDAPGHGDRVTLEQREAARARRAARAQGSEPSQVPRGTGDPTAPFPARFLQGVTEWKATLDMVEQLPDVGTEPTGYWCVSMGTSIGLPFSATEPRLTCTVLGLASMTPRPGREQYIGWAQSLHIPLLFLCQADDAGHPLDLALELYNHFGSAEKNMHINPGPHVGIPLFEREAAEAFYRRHLGVAGGY